MQMRKNRKRVEINAKDVFRRCIPKTRIPVVLQIGNAQEETEGEMILSLDCYASRALLLSNFSIFNLML